MRSEILQTRHDKISKKDTRRSAPGFHRRSMAEDQDTQTGAAVYPAFVQYSGDPQQISANDQNAPGHVPEYIAKYEPTSGDHKNRHQNCEIAKFPTKIREKNF